MSRKQGQFWHLEEDELLWKATKENGYLTNEQLSKLLPRRKPEISRRRVRLLGHQDGPIPRPSSFPHSWSIEDDQKLLRLAADNTNTWSSIAKAMGSEVTMLGCIGRFKRLKASNPQLERKLNSNHLSTLRSKKSQFSEEQIERYRELLDSQTLIGKPEEHVSAEKVAKMREDRAKGNTYSRIALAHGLTESSARHHCIKHLKPVRNYHKWTVEECFNLWRAHMIDGLSFPEICFRFGWTLASCSSQVKLMRTSGLWLKEGGTLSERILSKHLSKERSNCEHDDGEQLADGIQPYDEDEDKDPLGNEDEHRSNDNTEQLYDGDDRSAYDDTQLNINDQKKQDLRARNCMKSDHDLPTHFESESGAVFLEDKVVDDFVGCLGRLHDQSPSELRNVSLNTQPHFAAKGFKIKHELQENEKAVRTKVNAFLRSNSPSFVACKDDSSRREQIIPHQTESNAETHTQSQRHNFVEVQDVESIAIKPATMISQLKVEEYPRAQIDNPKESRVAMEAELRSSATEEILNYSKKRAPEEAEPEQKLEKIKKRQLSAVSNNPFTAMAASDGHIAEVQPQKLWLNASPCYKLPSIGRLPLFAKVLGQKNFIWIAGLIEARN